MKPLIKKNAVTPTPKPAENREPQFRAPGGHTHRSYVFYGRSGTGKTTVACTFPKPALLIDIKDVGDDSVADVKGLTVNDVHSWDEFELIYWWLIRNPKKFETVIIDTASQLQQLAILKIQQARGGTNIIKGRTVMTADDFGSMTKQGWGDVTALMKTWITNLRDLPMEVVFVAQDRTFNLGEDDSADGVLDPEVGPALSPSVAKHLNASVHLIGNTFIRRRLVKVNVIKNKKTITKEIAKIEFCLRIGPNPMYVTKLRKPKSLTPPSLLVDPAYSDLIKLIKGA